MSTTAAARACGARSLMSLMLLLLLGLAASLPGAVPAGGGGGSGTPASQHLLVYRLVLHTFWDRARFPKHFPDWRPPAQFSALIGRSHSGQAAPLFRVGAVASPGLRVLAETGRADLLDAALGQPAAGVLDQFTAPPVRAGVGRTETHFFVDTNHSKVSAVSRITPSPDWFIGIDSVDLLVAGSWLDSITLEADPLDAGTDNGFTFTAPNWRTEPPGPVYRITSRAPAHPAGSFYYPQLDELPPIATFQIIKVREYRLGAVFEHAADDLRYELVVPQPAATPPPPPTNNDDLQNEIEQERREQAPAPAPASTPPPAPASSPPTSTAAATSTSSVAPPAPLPLVFKRGDKKALRKHIMRYNKKAARRKLRSGIRDCRVGDWSAWGPCSQSCGIGEMQRRRKVVREVGRRGGRPCPPLVETRWCGSARTCGAETRGGYFHWGAGAP
ncbi:spondin-2-like [Schistocerca nitens]|uniref:spondin-2-like n=1 Tax=Schistocerca nitens TaxID=7011 RepID=UPI002119553E|nr:spondin-2-like [Schistocerca nitens]